MLKNLVDLSSFEESSIVVACSPIFARHHVRYGTRDNRRPTVLYFPSSLFLHLRILG